MINMSVGQQDLLDPIAVFFAVSDQAIDLPSGINDRAFACLLTDKQRGVLLKGRDRVDRDLHQDPSPIH